MDITVLENDKETFEFQLESLTLVEILRVYLNRDSAVSFAAWRREHPTKNPVLRLKTKGKTAKKALTDAIKAIEKDLDKTLADFEKLK